MKRVFLAACTLLAACATTKGGEAKKDEKKGGEPVMEKMALSNIIPFDVAACGPRELDLANPNGEVLTGALLTLGPAFQECFVDAKSRDGAPIEAKVKVTVSDKDPAAEVSGTGMTASGKACVEGAVKKLPLKPLAAGAAPIAAEIPLSPGAQVVQQGVNAASDVVAALRLAQTSACECYAKLGAGVAPDLKADIDITETAATLKLNEATELATCVEGKLKAVDLGKKPLKLTWPLLLKNSYASDVDTKAAAALQFQQLDGMRAQRTADVLMAAGRRVQNALAYDELGKKYKAKPTKPLLDELRAKCAEVVASDDKWIANLKALVGVYDSSTKLVMAEKAKDPQWGQVEGALAKQMTATTAEVTRVEAQKTADQNACPKVR